jgi:hypothetical protein
MSPMKAPITGYRALSADEIELINSLKQLGIEIEAKMQLAADAGADPRWLAIARTDLQIGMMALVRSVAKPTTF